MAASLVCTGDEVAGHHSVANLSGSETCCRDLAGKHHAQETPPTPGTSPSCQCSCCPLHTSVVMVRRRFGERGFGDAEKRELKLQTDELQVVTGGCVDPKSRGPVKVSPPRAT